MSDESPRVATIHTNIVDTLRHCQRRIDAGDPDFDDWVYLTRDACQKFIEEMTDIGFRMEPQKPSRAARFRAWMRGAGRGSA